MIIKTSNYQSTHFNCSNLNSGPETAFLPVLHHRWIEFVIVIVSLTKQGHWAGQHFVSLSVLLIAINTNTGNFNITRRIGWNLTAVSDKQCTNDQTQSATTVALCQQWHYTQPAWYCSSTVKLPQGQTVTTWWLHSLDSNASTSS